MLAETKYLLLILVLSLQACDLSNTISIRSGSLDDDYVEEPLSSMVEKYQVALTTSNNILTMISQGKHNDIHRIYFSDSMKSQLTRAQFADFMQQIKNNAGTMTNFKPMQWNFSTGEDQGVDLLYSVKIAEHENTMMKYLFVFDRDKPYTSLVGFFVKQREGVSAAGQF